MALTISEKSKDRIINSLFVASLVLFVVGVARPSLTNKTEDQPSSTYRAQRLAQLRTSERPEFNELSAVSVDNPDETTTISGQQLPGTTGSQASGSPSGTSNYTSNQPTQQIGLMTTLSGVLKKVL